MKSFLVAQQKVRENFSLNVLRERHTKREVHLNFQSWPAFSFPVCNASLGIFGQAS
jgi:hypothetical protein